MKASPTASQPYAALAYGCRWKSAFLLSLFQPTELLAGEADICVSLASPHAPPRSHHLVSGRLRFCSDGLRYLDDEGTVLDTYGADRVEIIPGPAWRGVLPAGFYGSATAALLAERGDLILHGSAVVLDGQALLICGHSGAGKSTLTAALIAAGGLLLSDDLSAVQLRSSDGLPVLFPGRRALRLFPDLAQLLAARVPLQTLPDTMKRKLLVAPPHADSATAYFLAAVLLLGPALPSFSSDGTTAMLLEHSYRRRAFRRLPLHAHRVATARVVAANVPILPFPAVEARDPASLEQVAQEALRVFAGRKTPG